MCLAIPVQVTELLDGDMARVTLDGVQKIISLALVEDVKPGDYVILHVGYALNKIDPEEAEATLALLAEAGQIDGSGRMKYVDEYRDGKLARAIAATIRAEARPDESYRFMEFCGGHTHAIARYGLEDLLPENVRMIHGPGCPVCVLPVGRMDDAIKLAQRPDITLCTYADLMRVPASNGMSLLKAKAAGADIRMVYSTLDALRIAREEPERKVVFFAIGFETTTPPTAMALLNAQNEGLTNFFVFCNHVLTPAAISALGRRPGGGGIGAARRLRRPGPCLDGDRHEALWRIRGELRQGRGHRRVRAARRDAGHADAGAPDQRGPRTRSRTNISAP